MRLSDRQRAILAEWADASSIKARIRDRARIVLFASRGGSYRTIAEELGMSPRRVSTWCERFRQGGVEALKKELPRRRGISAGVPDSEHQHDVGDSGCHRIHHGRSLPVAWTASPADAPDAIVGFHLAPRQSMAVFTCASRSDAVAAHAAPAAMVQAHDAARARDALLNALRHHHAMPFADVDAKPRRHAGWLGLLRLIHRRTSPGQDLHVICRDATTYERRNVREWLGRHPRFRVYCASGKADWLRAMASCLQAMIGRDVAEGALEGIDDLARSLERHVAGNRPRQAPFVWTALPHAAADDEGSGERTEG